MDIKEKLQSYGLKKVYNYIDQSPEENIPKILDWLQKYGTGTVAHQAEVVSEIMTDPDNNWYRLIMSLWSDIDPFVRKKLFETLVVNAAMIGQAQEEKMRQKYDCSIPWAILLDPTSACNLHCTGCWAAEYSDNLNLSFDELDSIILEAKAMGTYFFLYSGGEPLVRKDDIIKLCEKHPDCAFTCFTNGTLIDEQFCEDLLRVGNFVPGISIEGNEETTDDRRGKGTYQKVMRAMRLLREHKLPFGISCCYTAKNAEVIGNEAFIDEMVELGAKFAWLFTYIPVGVNAVPELMASAQQREFVYHSIRAYRKTKPLFTLDFWNDGEFVGGCIAGGRTYCHINAGGDVEPCAFIHYSDSNIREHTLLEAYKSPLFMAYREAQPFNCNHLRPCPLLDNPQALRGIIEKTGAKSTDMESPEDVRLLTGKCVDKAEAWAPAADRLWARGGGCKDCAGQCNQ